jgi:hypothetical protein
MSAISLFGIQFTLSLIGYALAAWWYLAPRLARMPRRDSLQPLLWVHAARVVGGAVLAPAAVGAGVPILFQRLVGIGDIVTAAIAIIALIMLRYRIVGAIAAVWLLLIFGMLDTVDAIIQSLRYQVFSQPLGVNWVIVTGFVPALLVSSALILVQLLRREGRTVETAATLVTP